MISFVHDSSEGATYLVGILNPITENERTVWLDRIIDKVQKQPLKSSLITKDIIEHAAKVIDRSGITIGIDFYRS